jgi:antirestriction protein ArdC
MRAGVKPRSSFGITSNLLSGTQRDSDASAGCLSICTDGLAPSLLLGIKADLQDASYIGYWLGILRSDASAIFTAARRAEEAAEYLFTTAR